MSLIIRYIDHAVRTRVASGGTIDFAPGLVDLGIFPELAPHTDGRMDVPRPDPPIFELRRHCQACEDRYRV